MGCKDLQKFPQRQRTLDKIVSWERNTKIEMNNLKGKINTNSELLLALHSSSNTLGVAILDSKDPSESISSNIFPIGRSLSNNIVKCVEEVLPASCWHQISRLSVAIGPGSFTGTRLSIVMARTLAQQLNCHVDGISSFALMAPRLSKRLEIKSRHKPFWIIKEMPRKGIIAGRYQIKKNSETNNIEEGLELEKPKLMTPEFKAKSSVNALDDVAIDVIHLIQLSLLAKNLGRNSFWQNILPIYTSSPVKAN